LSTQPLIPQLKKNGKTQCEKPVIRNVRDITELDADDILVPSTSSEPKLIDEEELAKQLDREIEESVEKNLQKKEEYKKNSIKLTVRTASGDEFKFRIQRTDPFSKIIQAVAQKQNVPEKSIVFKI